MNFTRLLYTHSQPLSNVFMQLFLFFCEYFMNIMYKCINYCIFVDFLHKIVYKNKLTKFFAYIIMYI